MTMHRQTRAALDTWAARCAVAPDKLKVDEFAGDDGTVNVYLPNTVEIEVVYDGAVDEEFIMDELYAVNVVDEVIVPSCVEEAAAAADSPAWAVYVRRMSNEFGDYAEPEVIREVYSSGRDTDEVGQPQTCFDGTCHHED